MTQVSERHMAENEVVFRQYNERIKKDFDAMKKIAQEDGQEHLIKESDAPLHFVCECSDEDCMERVILRPSRYADIHTNRRLFIVVTGHETESVEAVIGREDGFTIVEKFIEPDAPDGGLAVTEASNV